MQVFLPSFVRKAQEYSKHPLLRELLLPCHMRRAHPLPFPHGKDYSRAKTTHAQEP